jgi:DNA-binding MarR family transcriptional regulator
MASLSLLDAFALLRRELSLMVNQELKELNIGPKQMLVLYYLSLHGSASATVLSDYSQSDPAATSRTIASLEKLAWIKRTTDPSDSRRSILVLTASGKKAAQMTKAVRLAIATRLSDTLSVKEQSQLEKLLLKAAESLQNVRSKEQEESTRGIS